MAQAGSQTPAQGPREEQDTALKFYSKMLGSQNVHPGALPERGLPLGSNANECLGMLKDVLRQSM